VLIILVILVIHPAVTELTGAWAMPVFTPPCCCLVLFFFKTCVAAAETLCEFTEFLRDHEGIFMSFCNCSF
jgi:hypothetical protein